MEKKCDVIHVGYPKCASSFLQQVVFVEHPNIIQIRKNHRALLFELRDSAGSSHFNIDNYKKRFFSKFSKPITENDKIIVSFECLSDPQHIILNDKLLAKNIHKIFRDVKILVVLRKQYSIIFSI